MTTTIGINRHVAKGRDRRTTFLRTRHAHQAPPGLLHLVVPATVFLMAVAVIAWRMSGGSLFFMETPSMCPTICVGSLVVDRPFAPPVRVGELITFHPPGLESETYTHQVVRLLPNGAIKTKGLGNRATDPWLLTDNDIVGEGAFSIRGAGWILKALPLALLVVGCWLLGRPLIRRKFKPAWDVACMTVLLILPTLMLRPLVRAVVTETTVDKAHPVWQALTVVNTGLLPASFRDDGGSHVLVDPGSQATLSGATFHGHALVSEVVMLPWWGWLAVGLAVSSPLCRYLFQAIRAYESCSVASPRIRSVKVA